MQASDPDQNVWDFLPKLYSISAREIADTDADYLFGLRTNPSFSKHLSKVDGQIDSQRRFIRTYFDSNLSQRESYYFILSNSVTGLRCGTLRIYNFVDDSFEWGSWILDGNKSRFASIESGIFVYEFAFNILGFKRSKFEVNNLNTSVIGYHKKSGAEVTHQDQNKTYFEITKNKGLEFAQLKRNFIETYLERNTSAK